MSGLLRSSSRPTGGARWASTSPSLIRRRRRPGPVGELALGCGGQCMQGPLSAVASQCLSAVAPQCPPDVMHSCPLVSVMQSPGIRLPGRLSLAHDLGGGQHRPQSAAVPALPDAAQHQHHRPVLRPASVRSWVHALRRRRGRPQAGGGCLPAGHGRPHQCGDGGPPGQR